MFVRIFYFVKQSYFYGNKKFSHRPTRISCFCTPLIEHLNFLNENRKRCNFIVERYPCIIIPYHYILCGTHFRLCHVHMKTMRPFESKSKAPFLRQKIIHQHLIHFGCELQPHLNSLNPDWFCVQEKRTCYL